jgi:hypothetical protein
MDGIEQHRVFENHSLGRKDLVACRGACLWIAKLSGEGCDRLIEFSKFLGGTSGRTFWRLGDSGF